MSPEPFLQRHFLMQHANHSGRVLSQIKPCIAKLFVQLAVIWRVTNSRVALQEVWRLSTRSVRLHWTRKPISQIELFHPEDRREAEQAAGSDLHGYSSSGYACQQAETQLLIDQIWLAGRQSGASRFEVVEDALEHQANCTFASKLWYGFLIDKLRRGDLESVRQGKEAAQVTCLS